MDAWGLNCYDTGSHRTELDEHGRVGMARRDETRHGTPAPPRPQTFVFVENSVLGVSIQKIASLEDVIILMEVLSNVFQDGHE